MAPPPSSSPLDKGKTAMPSPRAATLNTDGDVAPPSPRSGELVGNSRRTSSATLGPRLLQLAGVAGSPVPDLVAPDSELCSSPSLGGEKGKKARADSPPPRSVLLTPKAEPVGVPGLAPAASLPQSTAAGGRGGALVASSPGSVGPVPGVSPLLRRAQALVAADKGKMPMSRSDAPPCNIACPKLEPGGVSLAASGGLLSASGVGVMRRPPSPRPSSSLLSPKPDPDEPSVDLASRKGKGKRPRSPSPPRSPTPDPDGNPALFGELLARRPDILGSIQDIAESARVRGGGYSTLRAGGIEFGGAEGSSSRSNAARASASDKGKGVMGESSASVHASSGCAGGQSLARACAQGQSAVPAVAAPRGGRVMIRPQMDPLRLYRGLSFQRNFNTPFVNSIEIPVQFWLRIPNRETNSVIIFGEVMMGFEVRVQQVNGRCMFTEGWRAFVEAERISRFDTALFVWLGLNTIGMRLYGANGAERPLSSRPPFGHPMLQDFAVAGAGLPIGGANVHVPDNLVNMVYEVAVGIQMSPQLMQTIANVWHNQEANYPLYVCNITRSQTGDRAQFFFSVSFSRYLRHGIHTTLFLAGSPAGLPAVVSRYDEQRGVARIITGWNTFTAWAGIHFGDTFVVSVMETPEGRYEIRFFSV